MLGPGAATGTDRRTGLAWPPGIHRTETLHIAVDSALSIGALLYIWTLFVLPRWEVPAASAQAQVGSLGRWAYFLAMSVLVLFIASSRRTGSLPLKQLLLLFGGMEVLFVMGTVREIVVAAGGPAIFALVGYWAGVTMIVAMLQRSAAEVETPRQQATRTVIAFLLPASLVLIAGLLVIDLALESEPDSRLLAVAPILWASALLGVAVASAAYMLRLRQDRHGELTSQLSESAERGWIGALLRDSSEYVFVLDPTGRIVYASPRSQNVLKTTTHLHELVFVPSSSELDQLLSGVVAQATPAGPHQMIMHAADGSMRIVLVHLRPVREVSFAGFVVSGTDVTAERHMAAQLESTGQRDQLTGLLSPSSLARSVADALSEIAGSQDGLAYAVFDLVDFGCGTTVSAAMSATRSCERSHRRPTVCWAGYALSGGSAGTPLGFCCGTQRPDVDASLPGCFVQQTAWVDPCRRFGGGIEFSGRLHHRRGRNCRLVDGREPGRASRRCAASSTPQSSCRDCSLPEGHE